MSGDQILRQLIKVIGNPTLAFVHSPPILFGWINGNESNLVISILCDHHVLTFFGKFDQFAYCDFASRTLTLVIAMTSTRQIIKWLAKA